MTWAKIHFTSDDDETNGFYGLVRRAHVICYKESGRQIFQVSVSSLDILKELGIPFEIDGYTESERPDHLVVP